MIPVDRINKALMAWAGVCTLFLGVAVVSYSRAASTKFFTFGPREDLVILDVPINTFGRYFIVILYTMISTVARTVLQEVVSPWLIQTVQNDKPKDQYAHKYALEVSMGEVLYRWFDWFMYMHILLAQVDMMIVELAGNLVVVAYTTRMYMKTKEEDEVELVPSTQI